MKRLEIDIEKLNKLLDGKPFSKYKILYKYYFVENGLQIYFTKIQSDPFAPPSVLEIQANFPYNYTRKPLEDFLYRRIYQILKTISKKRGSGNSGKIFIPKPSNVVLRRSAVQIENNKIYIRVFFGLPAFKRRILYNEFVNMLANLSNAIKSVLILNKKQIINWIQLYKEQEYIRKFLVKNKYISFIANGSILPRKCGSCEEPLSDAVPFESPVELRYELELPTGRTLEGALIKNGIISITGTAFRGKTTLLNAILQGIYNHVLGDGREYVISNPNIVYVFSEDGRVINNVDLSSFIHINNAQKFYTENASGSTSLAAMIQEYIEAGSNTLLIDEDTSAVNLLYYNKELYQLFGEKTITTLQELLSSFRKNNINVIVVNGSNYEFLANSDLVIVARKYKYFVVKINSGGSSTNSEYKYPKKRKILDVRIKKVKIKGNQVMINNNFTINNNLQTIREANQLSTISYSLYLVKKFVGYKLTDFCQFIEIISRDGRWHKLINPVTPNLSEIRKFEACYFINRLPRNILTVI